MGNFSIKKIIGSIILMISLISGVWLIEDRYVNASEMCEIKTKIYLRMDTQEFRELTKEYYQYKKLVNENPNDMELREQLNDIKKEKEKVKERIDNTLINGD